VTRINKRYYLPYVEFYITNVCNLTCRGCNRFNNLDFKGSQNWKQYKEVYRRWSDELDLGYYSVLGGEPTLNPTFMEWLEGLQELWPGIRCELATNGTRLDKNPELYDLCKKYSGLIDVWVSCHNEQEREKLLDIFRSFFKRPFKEEFDKTPYREKYIITDANGVKGIFEDSFWFHQGAVNNVNGKLNLQTSDPKKAHDNCHSKYCHHFDKGKLYKCGPSSLFSQLDQQLGLNLNANDRKIVYGYQPLEIEHGDNFKKDFIDNLPNQIDMCKFCPEKYDGKKIFSKEKKFANIIKRKIAEKYGKDLCSW